MLGRAPLDIPVSVGLAWGIILYTARLFSDGLRLPWVAAAALDTLLALNIDLTMDVIAYRMHMWHWDWTRTGLDPLKAEWFGVPYANFVGWISVVFFYSFFSRLYERTIFRRPNAWRFPAVAVLALISAQVELLVTEDFIFHWLNAAHFGPGWRLITEVVARWGWRAGAFCIGAAACGAGCRVWRCGSRRGSIFILSLRLSCWAFSARTPG